MSDTTVKIRYIGPMTDGLWTPEGAYPAFDFPHGEYVEVPAALAAELLEHREPIPPGDPVFDEELGQLVTKLEPVWELADGDASKLPAPAKETAEPKPAKNARKGAKV